MERLDTLTLGLATAYSHASLMPRPHRHNEVEMNVTEQGAMSYLFGGTRQRIEPGQIALFWAAVPHQVVAAVADEQAVA